jgi:hypothetical protein
MANQRICSVEGCDNRHYGNGFCAKHRYRWQKHGDPLVTVRPANGELLRWIEDVALKYEGDECLPWPFRGNIQGYAKAQVEGRAVIASRYLCERVHGSPPTSAHVAAHSCGKGHLGCMAKRHLSWKTQKEKVADMVEHGTANRGERCNLSKLSECDVLTIRKLSGGPSQSDIASRFGIDQSTVSDIVRRKSWAWL